MSFCFHFHSSPVRLLGPTFPMISLPLVFAPPSGMCLLIARNIEMLQINPVNPLNAELYPICHLLALLGAHLIFHVSRIRVNVSSSLLSLKLEFVLAVSITGP